MQNKIYYLSTCDTCRRILQELDNGMGFELQDIKSSPLTPVQLDALREKAGSYEALFSRRARKFRAMGLHEQSLTEEDYRRLLLEEYTFLNRPVIIANGQVFIGSGKHQVESVRNLLKHSL